MAAGDLALSNLLNPVVISSVANLEALSTDDIDELYWMAQATRRWARDQ